MQHNPLPDTPWHVGCVKKEENDPRRHKARCIYLVEGVCHQGKLRTYMQRCPGSSHCKYYAEDESMAHDVYLKTRSVEEEILDKERKKWLRGKLTTGGTISYSNVKDSKSNKLIFSGIESLNMLDINLPQGYSEWIPNEEKLQNLLEYYNQYRKMDKPIVVEVRNDKYYLKSNYLQYYVSKKLGKKWIKATMENKLANGKKPHKKK